MAHFIWHELNSTDPDAAARFYGAVVGWDTTVFEDSGDYRLWTLNGRNAGGLMQLPELARERGPFWVGYLGVADVDADVRQLRAAGATVTVEPQDIPAVGRFAVMADPQGAVFMLLAPLPQEDAPEPVPPGTPGHVSWHELNAKDGPSAWDFYGPHFGWQKDTAMDMGPMGVYQIFAIDGQQAGAIMTSPLPRPQWLFYIQVADIDAARAAIESNDGTVLHGPVEVPGGNLIVQAQDPQGAMFALVGPRPA